MHTCEQIADSEKLFCEEIDVGEEQPRQIASGLRAHFTLENFCPGRKVVVVTNLKAAKMAGFESQGMVMASVLPEVAFRRGACLRGRELGDLVGTASRRVEGVLTQRLGRVK